VPQLLTVVEELKNKFGKWKFLGVKLIDFKDYPALLISNTTITYRAHPGFDLHFGVLCPFLQVIIKKDTKKDTVIMEIVLFVQLNLALKKAKSLLAGGNSGDSKSKHFNDQACIEKEFKDVLFYKEEKNPSAATIQENNLIQI
jgi:hypothetical protein